MDFAPLFQRKSVKTLLAESHSSKNRLKRSLSAPQVVLMGVGGIIGAGIFVLTGHAAAANAGPAIILSFLIAGLASGFAAFCYAELAAMIPVAGSAYTFAYATLGEFLAWIIGWDLILEYLFGSAAVAVGWSSYLASLMVDLGFPIPTHLAQAPFSFDARTGWAFTGAVFNCPAAVITLLCSALLIIGIRESALFSNFVVALKLLVLGLFVVVGAQYVDPANWTPFIPENTGSFGEFGWSGVFRGAAVVFFAYIGFDCVSTLAQETKNPQRDMPIGIIGSLLVATVVYVLVALVLTGMVHHSTLKVADPIAVAVNASPELSWLRPLIKVGAVVGLTSVIIMLLLGQTRVFYSMANDGLLPRSFAMVHRRFHTPWIPTVITGILASILAGLAPIGILGEMVSIGTLLAFMIVCLGVVALRYTDKESHRPFRVPAVWIVGPAGALCAAAQMIALPLETWERLLLWMALGIAIYFGYSRGHSRLRRKQLHEQPPSPEEDVII